MGYELKGLGHAFDTKTLKPCPFCKKHPLTSIDIADDRRVRARIFCPDGEAKVEHISDTPINDFYEVTFAMMKAEENGTTDKG